MKVTIYDTHQFERPIFAEANRGGHDLRFVEVRLSAETIEVARGSDVVCCFAHDKVDRHAIHRFHEMGVRLIALRSAGFNHCDLDAARECKMPVVRVPDYSPYSVAEHAVGLLQTLNRKIHRAFNRVRELNFSLEGLVGADLHGKTIGVVGAGRIGRAFCKIMAGFGCEILIHDLERHPEMAAIASYVSLENLLKLSDVISLHAPLTADTHHLINAAAFAKMKASVILINTSRGALVDSKALIQALKQRRIGGACLDVYEEEENVFFKDLSAEGIDDDLLARLLTFPNVLITAHQAFLTSEALHNIVETTLDNIDALSSGYELRYRLT